jgi:hypothetical protein
MKSYSDLLSKKCTTLLVVCICKLETIIAGSYDYIIQNITFNSQVCKGHFQHCVPNMDDNNDILKSYNNLSSDMLHHCFDLIKARYCLPPNKLNCPSTNNYTLYLDKEIKNCTQKYTENKQSSYIINGFIGALICVIVGLILFCVYKAKKCGSKFQNADRG